MTGDADERKKAYKGEEHLVNHSGRREIRPRLSARKDFSGLNIREVVIPLAINSKQQSLFVCETFIFLLCTRNIGTRDNIIIIVRLCLGILFE